MQECLLVALASKTVVYVTHQIEFLPAADLILVSISLAHVSCNFIVNFFFGSPYKIIAM